MIPKHIRHNATSGPVPRLLSWTGTFFLQHSQSRLATHSSTVTSLFLVQPCPHPTTHSSSSLMGVVFCGLVDLNSLPSTHSPEPSTKQVQIAGGMKNLICHFTEQGTEAHTVVEPTAYLALSSLLALLQDYIPNPAAPPCSGILQLPEPHPWHSGLIVTCCGLI